MIRASKTDQAWKQWGDVDPYYGVITDDKFRSDKLDEQTRQEFFQTGQQSVDHVLKLCRKHIRPDFAPQTVLDYGCGVGRMAIAFAQHAQHVTGIDVSEGMLAEAKANQQRFGIENIELLRIAGTTLPTDKRFDLVHCYIVLQHIHPQQGIEIFRQLVAAVADGGVGAIQLTYSQEKFADNCGRPPHFPSLRTLWRSVWGNSFLRKWLGALLGSPKSPPMQMNPYSLNSIFFLLQRAGAKDLHVEFTNHGGHLGVFLIFTKQA
ncbi:class I SAM-dependent methyltransferase [Blastopirellula marina]|uniref:class I SAM-dependent methyltransferase n=1 Tax=Blastopirellula marina TaxID=124 RepID=UPI0013047CD3|nr:class I SAM-dependent methyltransferase [Blastopirellula marina]